MPRRSSLMPLERQLKQLIALNGPIPIDMFMKMAIEHYYSHVEPFGKSGDFITAPEISQMFGEIIGIWCAHQWQLNGQQPFILVEIGAGNGTLMSDLLRSTKNVPGFHDAIKKIIIIEISNRLISIQKSQINFPRIEWKSHISEINNNNCYVICNEFFDALPIKQYVKEDGYLQELAIKLDTNDNLVIAKSLVKSPTSSTAKDGQIIELSPTRNDYMKTILEKSKDHGVALIIDYGYIEPPYKSTLQAVKNHKHHPILSDIGGADLTSLVDFKSLQECCNERNSQIYTQGDFLNKYGIIERSQTLINVGANPTKINSALHRLTNKSEMGELFKVLEVI
jgi:NADH dehydrogenase [ubiquinone] 1 alpha subcomplex assembly factor 7